MALPPGSLLEHTPQGLYCRSAAAWIDPVGPVPRALITHAHADHARPGCGEYWAVGASEAILRQLLGAARSRYKSLSYQEKGALVDELVEQSG